MLRARCDARGGRPVRLHWRRARGLEEPTGSPSPPASLPPQIGGWTTLAELPQARSLLGAVVLDGQVYVAGGRVAPGSREELAYRYDPVSDRWNELAPLPRVRFDAPLAATSTWSTLPPLPTSRREFGAAYLDGVIYTAAGSRGGFGLAFEAYDIQTQQWTTLPDVPTPRGAVAVVAFQGQIYVLGGEGIDDNLTFDTVERFDPGTGTWEEVAPMPFARRGLGGVALDDRILVIGGDQRAARSIPGGGGQAPDTASWQP